MPLFGSKHKHDNEHNTLHKTGDHHDREFAGAAPGNFPASTGITSVPMGGSGGMSQMYPQHTLADGPALTGQHNHTHGHQGLGTGATGHHGLHDDPYAAGGVGTGASIPSTGVVNHGDPAHHTGGAGTRMTGKVESALGSMVGSSALKAKGLQKEQEANAVKLQGRELAEAERLEKEALMRRERAVGHGAHPANSQLGAGSVTGAGGPAYTN